MKLIKCNSCQRETLDAFGSCQHCGAQLVVERSQEGGAPGAPTHSVIVREEQRNTISKDVGESSTTSGQRDVPEWAKWETGMTKEEQDARKARLHKKGHAVADEGLLAAIRSKAWYGYRKPAAGLPRRSLAFLIDTVLVGFPTVVLWGLLGNALPSDVRVMLWFIVLLGPVMYFGITDGTGGTLGKRLVGIEVTSMEGRPMGIPTNLVRSFVKVYLSSILLLGYLIAIFDDDLRTLHDRIVVSYVSRRLKE